MKRCFILLAFVGSVPMAVAQAVISDGTSTFGWTNTANLSGATVRTGTGGGTTAVFTVNGSPNQSFQNWWWYRVGGVNAREFALSNQSAAPVVSGNNMLLSYREPEGFTSRLEYTINNIGTSALVTGTNFIKNEGNSALTLDLFNYFDVDMAGTAAGDVGALLSGNPAIRMRVNDPASQLTFEYRALDAMAYQATTFSTLRGNLADANVDNFNNTGFPFGPGDFTGGVQWSFTLNPGEMIALQTSMELNAVPEPATMAALALGVGYLVRRRRK